MILFFLLLEDNHRLQVLIVCINYVLKNKIRFNDIIKILNFQVKSPVKHAGRFILTNLFKQRHNILLLFVNNVVILDILNIN